MKKYNFILTASLALVLTASLGTVAFAQEQAEGSADVEVTSDRAEAANYNNTRSNRSGIAAPELDAIVCDGVTCSDGSCAATVDECPMTNAAAAAEVSADGAVTVGAGDDCDDTDERCTPGAAEPADARCDTVDEDCDGDGLDDGQRVQDYNSSRSNKPSSAANPADNLDDDSDGDGLPTQASARAATEAQLFGEYRSEVGRNGTKALKKGDRLSTAESENASDGKPEFDRFSDIKGEVRVDEETGKRELASVSVAAQDVRDWSNDDREAFNRLQAAVASNTPEHASVRIAQQVLNNDRIENLEVTQTEARINYRAQMRLFGLIPIEREVEGRAQAKGTVEIDYPWYRFLSTTPDREEIENQLRMSIEIMMTLTADPI